MKNSPSPAESNPLVFVYGTLKRGCHNHCLLQQIGAEFVATGRTAKSFPLVVDGLPYLLGEPGRGYRVEGEIYRIPGVDGWRALDRLEGHPKFYQRRLTDIAGDDHENYSAWVYFLARADERLTTLAPVRAYKRDGRLSWRD